MHQLPILRVSLVYLHFVQPDFEHRQTKKLGVVDRVPALSRVIERDQPTLVTDDAQVYGTIRRGGDIPAMGGDGPVHAAILPCWGRIWLGNRGKQSFLFTVRWGLRMAIWTEDPQVGSGIV